MRARGREAGVGAALALGACVFGGVAVCAAAAWPADSPLVPAAGGSLAGDRRLAWIYLAASALAFVAYLVALLVLRRLGGSWASRRRPVTAVAAVAVAIQLTPLAAPLLISTDAWTYWDYGRIAAVHDANPYARTPDDFPSDPAFHWVGRDWRDSTSVYGPAFTLASEPVALAAGSSHDAAAWIFKLIAAAAVLAATAGAVLLARAKAFACAFVGWNPLVALHFAGGGHNDAWMAALVVGALVAASTRRRGWAGAAWALGILVKWIPLVFLPLRALEARASRRRVGHAAFAGTALAVAAVATWRYGLDWLGTFGPLARNANRETRFALPHRLEQAGAPEALALGLAAAVFAAGYLWLAREAWRGRVRLGLAACLVLLVTPYLAPWYVMWALPLAAAEEDGHAQLLVLAVSAYVLRQAVPV